MKTTLIGLGMVGSLALAMGCDAGDHSAPATGGSSTTSGATTTTTAGSSGTTSSGSTGAGGSVASPISGLPVPPGAGDEPAPSGAAQGLQVLPWAGFKSAETFSFDDSQPSQIDNWAALKATGVPLTFYMNAANNWYAGFDAMFKDALASGCELGDHTYHHCHADLTAASSCPTAATVPFATDALEVSSNATYLVSTLGVPEVLTMAYPFGDEGWEPSAKANYFIARGIGSTGVVLPNDATDPYNLPTYVANTMDTAAQFNPHVDTAESMGGWNIFTIHTLLPTASGNVWYNPVNASDVASTINYAKSKSDIWIGTLVNVGAYWIGEKLLTTATPSTSGGATTWKWTLPAHFPTGKFLRVKVAGGKLTQGSQALTWDGHGYYEVALDAGTLTLAP